MYSITKLITFILLIGSATAQKDTKTDMPEIEVGCIKNDETKWQISVIDHPDLAHTFGDISVSGGKENVKKFFSEVPISIYPECNADDRRIDSFFDVFTDTEARGIDITLHCTCCPLKCKRLARFYR